MDTCPYCREPIVLSSLVKHRKKRVIKATKEEKEQANQRHKARKIRVLIHYGGNSLYPVCIHCGEMRLACLSIDHINGGGAQHRMELGLNSGSSFYAWLEKADYPEGYQTLCMNCQFAKKEEEKEYNGSKKTTT